MSGLNFLERLLDGVAVEWKPLGDLCVIGDGLHGTPKYDDSGEYYFINGNNLDKGRIVYNDKTKKVDELIFKKHGIVFTVENTIFMSINGTIGSVSFFNNERIVLGKSVAFFNIKSSELYSRFLFYFLLTEYSKNYFEAQKTGSTIKNLGLKALRTFKIPIPPIAIQAEIVRILDTFTELTAELTAELCDRQKQYNYYRDRLLTFEEGEVEWKTLGEIGEILRGTAITEKKASSGDYPVVANGPSHNYFHDQSNRSGETIVIARSGVYAGLVSYWDIPIFLTDAFSIHPDNNALSSKFLYYVLKKDQTKIHNMSKGAGVPHVRAKEFESYKVPILPLEEQAHIVAILDKFNTLTTSISEGLPREIALRQKQYEYYRDLLLSFPPPLTPP